MWGSDAGIKMWQHGEFPSPGQHHDLLLFVHHTCVAQVNAILMYRVFPFVLSSCADFLSIINISGRFRRFLLSENKYSQYQSASGCAVFVPTTVLSKPGTLIQQQMIECRGCSCLSFPQYTNQNKKSSQEIMLQSKGNFQIYHVIGTTCALEGDAICRLWQHRLPSKMIIYYSSVDTDNKWNISLACKLNECKGAKKPQPKN